MAYVSTATLDRLRDDVDAREEAIRQVVRDRLGEDPAPGLPDHFVATYDFAFRTTTLQRAVEEISDHAISVIEHLPKGSLLEQCSARRAGVDLFDASGRIGLLHVAFPLNHERS
jgi:ribulose-bisphosphate carboxylase large chain